MHLRFLGRTRERSRLLRAFRASEGQLVCVVGRRRLGKSRLLQEVLKGLPAVYVVGDDRSAPLQREVVAREIARLLPGFSAVQYPSWDALLERWYREAPEGAVLALDEFPSFVASSPELPSILQRWVDGPRSPARHLALCGSSQRMMLGLLLDATAPLYGRAREILRLGPLEIADLPEALHATSARQIVEHWAVWGGVPRYWELAADYPDLWSAVSDLILDPMGILHQESQRLLLDDMREVARAGSLLALVGQGCMRPSELGARLGQPTTSLARPLARLVELDLLRREVPWDAEPRDTKRSLYCVADPFLAFWYRFGDPERSRLGAGQIDAVLGDIQRQWSVFLGKVWEDLARDSVARRSVAGRTWLPAARWWGREAELDLVARSPTDPRHVLVGEAKLSARPGDVAPLLADLGRRAAQVPALAGYKIENRLWILEGVRAGTPSVSVGQDVIGESASG